MNVHEVMKSTGRQLLWSVSTGVLLTVTAAQAADAPAPNPLVLEAREEVVGTPAPAVTLTTIDGETIDLGELYGDKAVYLKFWATWCLPCQQQMPHFEHTYQQAGDDLEVIGINAGFNETLQDILDFREDYGIHMPIVVDDGALAAAFDFRITPQHIVIGKDGLIKYVGHLADAEVDAALEKERRAPDVSAVAGTTLGSAPALGVGDMLPAKTVQVGSTAISLNDRTQEGTVMVFMSSWCESYLADSRPDQAATCRAVREQVEALKQQYPAARWLGVSSRLWTAEADLSSYAAENGVTLPLALDDSGDLFRTFNVMTVPTVIVADGDGKIVSRLEGHDASLGKMLSSLMD